MCAGEASNNDDMYSSHAAKGLMKMQHEKSNMMIGNSLLVQWYLPASSIFVNQPIN